MVSLPTLTFENTRGIVLIITLVNTLIIIVVIILRLIPTVGLNLPAEIGMVFANDG